MGYQSPRRCGEVVSDCRSIETAWRSRSDRESVEVPRRVSFATVVAAARGETGRVTRLETRGAPERSGRALRLDRSGRAMR
ncbi:hypothetical protein MRB53_002634 [Persea americana]|uniref:Uncharacterized protein n=1 Tax=Persea americana TaxID=3435 RepID=A0ACC2MVY6_PERAE|nr:hypothetical protein MRB53_002634 [Persea americana]